MYDDEFEIEEYTFAEYCADRDILPIDTPPVYYLGMFDVYGEDYINFCKSNNLLYERL